MLLIDLRIDQLRPIQICNVLSKFQSVPCVLSIINWILLNHLLCNWLWRCSGLQVLVGNMREIEVNLSIILLGWLSCFLFEDVSSAEFVWVLGVDNVWAIHYLNNIKFVVANAVLSACYLNLFAPGTLFRFLVHLLKIP